MRVWLDDERPAPPGWVWVFTPEQAIGLLERGDVTEMALDHDLGLPDTPEDRTGYAVLLWLEREVGNGRWDGPLPEISVHSANPAGRRRMLQVIATIHRLRDLHGEPGAAT